MTDNISILHRTVYSVQKIRFLKRKCVKMDEKTASEQLEEGEIVDDDDFEDISDNSIIDSAFGKFVSSNEKLRALSLSSDSEIERLRVRIRHKRKVLHRKHKIKQRKRKRVRQASHSSNSDIIEPSQDLKGKLKEAIHISGIEEGHKNTLEARLKAMGGLGATSDGPVAVAETVTMSVEMKETETKKEDLDKTDDVELENLRMEALKTAMLNKCQRRKRKKALLEATEIPTPLQTLENKENNTPKDESEKKNNGDKVVIDDIEEDEDVLRASLLAALAKKISKKQTPNESIIQVRQVAPKLPVSIIPVLPKRPIYKFKHKTLTKLVNKPVMNKMISKMNRPKPQVQPLIINVNADSDSDEDAKAKPELKIVPDLHAIATNVEKFLKEQRAKFEIETQKKSQIREKILEKSAVKLLPKSQQIEYQQLVKKLRNAERRKRAKKAALENNKVQVQPTQTVTVIEPPQSAQSVKGAPLECVAVAEPCAQAAESEVDAETVNLGKSSSGSAVILSTMSDASADKSRQRITSELTTLQKTLKEIKMQRNGSLQIKSKYQVLTPVIRKITVTSNDRKKQELRIKTLLQELSEAKNNLTRSHERFSTLVRELVANKEKIDRSSQESKPVEMKIDSGKVTNMTDRGKKFGNQDLRSLPVTSTPIKSPADSMEEATVSTLATNSANNECEDMDVCHSDEAEFCQIDIVDPNDIDQIFKRRSPMKSTIPEYISPLSYPCYERYRNVDPLGIMCPYEVNGSCRDSDCMYKHYLKG